MISAGAGHTLGLRSDGTVWAWGDNSIGQLGDGTGGGWDVDNYSITPVQVPGLTNVTAVAAAQTPHMAMASLPAHNVALRGDGTVWTWGSNIRGQLGIGTAWADNWENESNAYRAAPVQVPNFSNVTAVSAGAEHTVALRADGTVWAWGANSSGQLGIGVIEWNQNHDAFRTTPMQVSNLTNITAISAGGLHTVALRADGTVWAWGSNFDGQLGNGVGGWDDFLHTVPVQVVGLDNVAAISAGGGHTMALRNDGTVWAWGANGVGQLGDGTGGWDDDATFSRSTPVQVPGLSNITAISAGGRHTVVLRNDGVAWTWGANGSGQLGDGTGGTGVVGIEPSRTTPVQVQGLTNATMISAGGEHTVALRNDGSVWSWGSNWNGVLGCDGAGYYDEWGHYHNYRTTPVQVLGSGGVGHLNLFSLFPDVRADHWGRQFVLDAHESGFMNGNPDGTFAPYGHLTRAQAAQILANKAGVGAWGALPRPAANPFPDVPVAAWYSPVIYWASENNIMNGHADGTFGPGQPITREQFAVILRNFAAWQGYDTRSPAGGGAQWPFVDNASISWWAVDAVRWANYHEIILGDGHGFRPSDVPLRVEAATMVVRFDNADLPLAPEPAALYIDGNAVDVGAVKHITENVSFQNEHDGPIYREAFGDIMVDAEKLVAALGIRLATEDEQSMMNSGASTFNLGSFVSKVIPQDGGGYYIEYFDIAEGWNFLALNSIRYDANWNGLEWDTVSTVFVSSNITPRMIDGRLFVSARHLSELLGFQHELRDTGFYITTQPSPFTVHIDGKAADLGALERITHTVSFYDISDMLIREVAGDVMVDAEKLVAALGIRRATEEEQSWMAAGEGAVVDFIFRTTYAEAEGDFPGGFVVFSFSIIEGSDLWMQFHSWVTDGNHPWAWGLWLVSSNVPPRMIDGRLFVSASQLCELLGFSYELKDTGFYITTQQ